MGKSELLNALGAHFIKAHSVKVFMAKPEEEAVRGLFRFAAKEMKAGGCNRRRNREMDSV